MKALHTVTAIIEAATGVALLLNPSFVVTLLLGSPLDAPVALVLARVTGIALLALGIACWRAHGLIPAILFYNVAVAALLAFAGLSSSLVGIALWPAVALHAVMGGWCIAILLSKPK